MGQLLTRSEAKTSGVDELDELDGFDVEHTPEMLEKLAHQKKGLPKYITQSEFDFIDRHDQDSLVELIKSARMEVFWGMW